MKALIDRAIEKLNTVKGLRLIFKDIKLKSDIVELWLYEEYLQSNLFISLAIPAICEALHPDEPQHLSVSDIRILRIAHVIYDEYKRLLAITNSNLQTLSASNLDLGNITYDINLNGQSLTATIDDVDELKTKIKDLEDINDRLINEVGCLKAILQSKGIL